MDSYCQSQRGRLTLKPPLQIVIPNRRCGNGSICVASPDRFDDVPVAHRASLAHVGGTQNRWKKETDRRDEGVFGVYFVICPGGTGQCASQMWMAMKACGSWGFDFEGGSESHVISCPSKCSVFMSKPRVVHPGSPSNSLYKFED